MHNHKKVSLTVVSFILICGASSVVTCLAQNEADDLKQQALVEENLEASKLNRIEQEDPDDMTDAQVEQGEEDLQANERDLENRFQEESEQTREATDDMLGVGDDDFAPLGERRDLHEEVDHRLEDERATQNNPFE
ncbi:MAG TPA: hypothetical protein VD913_05085 [bacterium]|nr:hypothetical protein [bacterium]